MTVGGCLISGVGEQILLERLRVLDLRFAVTEELEIVLTDTVHAGAAPVQSVDVSLHLGAVPA